MNFKSTKEKTIISPIIGIFLVFVDYLGSFYGGLGYTPRFFSIRSITIFLVVTITVYVNWSLIQKKK